MLTAADKLGRIWGGGGGEGPRCPNLRSAPFIYKFI